MNRTSDLSAELVWRRGFGACLVGFAVGGFFDGILLHQILQWHHLFSAVVPDDTLMDLRFQILADGLFHLLHYVVGLAGLAFLWFSRTSLKHQGADRHLAGWALVSFGTWHVVDAVLFHWVLQIHRIRMDVSSPLLWDLGWLVPFGILPLACGIWLLRNQGKGRPPQSGKAGIVITVAALVTGPAAAVPPATAATDDMAVAVFRPGLTMGEMIAAVDAVDGRLVWTDAKMGVWVIALGPDARAVTLYRHGALMVSGGAIAVGCLNWTEV